MSVRLAAAAAWVAALFAALPAMAAAPLTLDGAFARVAVRHPELRLADVRAGVLVAERDRAALGPAPALGLQAENALGTGAFEGLQAVELTLSLASVLERGGKLDARRTLAQERIDALAVERETRRLDLLAEVARRYLAASAALHQREIAVADIEQRQRAESAARERLRAGASPESVVLTAQAALALAQLAEARAGQQWLAARGQLAALWGEKQPQFTIAAGNPLVLPAVPDAAALAALLERTPELARFASEQRIAEARLQLARTAATPDAEWQVGLRRLEAADGMALMAGFSVPLGSKRRADPGIRAAGAELALLAVEREAQELTLYAVLAEAHGRYRLAQLEVQRLGEEVLPLLARAEAAAALAWRAGASSYLDWSQLQSELTAIRRRQLEVAIDAQYALIEIQRLTGQPFVAATTTGQGNIP